MHLYTLRYCSHLLRSSSHVPHVHTCGLTIDYYITHTHQIDYSVWRYWTHFPSSEVLCVVCNWAVRLICYDCSHPVPRGDCAQGPAWWWRLLCVCVCVSVLGYLGYTSGFSLSCMVFFLSAVRWQLALQLDIATVTFYILWLCVC